jgi:hypothetical protein
MTAIADEHTQSRQRMGTGLRPTHAIALLAPSGQVIIGALDRAAGIP